MQAVSTGKPTRKFVYKFMRNSQFLYVKFHDFSPNSEMKRPIYVPIVKKKINQSPSGKRTICVFRALKNPRRH